MKFCINCKRINPADVVECIECGEHVFYYIDLNPPWLQAWEEENRDGEADCSDCDLPIIGQ